MLRWEELVHRREEDLAAEDIAPVNLACAAGLPDAEDFDEAECINRLNHYASGVRQYTQKRLPEFHRRPEVYDGSEAIFRVVCMVTLLQRMYAVRYNPAKRAPDAPFDTADTFIHGALLGDGGTCASLPVVYAALGRRLGYPLRLVAVRSHLLVRWDEPGGQRFNIEVNDNGTDAPPDDYYRQGMYEISPVAEVEYCYLISQTLKMELAGFLAQRGHRWLDLRRHREAAESFLWASALVPENKSHAYCAKQTLEAWRHKLKEMTPPGCPEMSVTFPAIRRWPGTVPLGVERFFMVFEATEACLTASSHQHWWEALKRSSGQRPSGMPAKIELRVTA
jgi:hypothetical protein